MEEEFLKYIKQSNQILITSHISPDTDAIASLLLLGSTLKFNFPDKQITMVMEELFAENDFLYGYDQIIGANLASTLKKSSPELLIMLDGSSYGRFSRKDESAVHQLVKENAIKTVIIDHHEGGNVDHADVYINNLSPAATMDIYEVCFESLKLHKPENYAQTAMTGIYADSAGFKYCKPSLRGKMLAIAKELVEAGADIEQIYFQLNKYTKKDFEVLGHLISNLSSGEDYNFTWLDDDFVSKWLEHSSQTDLQAGTDIFINEYIRNIEGRRWGFVIYKNTIQGDKYYSVSFRSVNGTKDVSKIAAELGGGGHKGAAGAKFEADSVEDAINQVKTVISRS